MTHIARAANPRSRRLATPPGSPANPITQSSRPPPQLLEACRATMRKSGWILTPALFAPDLDLADDFPLLA